MATTLPDRSAIAADCGMFAMADLVAEERERLARTYRALMLAPKIEIAEALLRGEDVPLDRLDQDWLARFGRSGS